MTPLENPKSQTFLAYLESLPEDAIVNYFNESDPIDQLIYGENLRIKMLHFHPDLNLWLIVLNNGKILKRTLSAQTSLAEANLAQLEQFELLGNGTGIHWPELDMDLSLRGFLLEEITHLSQSLVA